MFASWLLCRILKMVVTLGSVTYSSVLSPFIYPFVDFIQVTWDGEEDPDDPYNWPGYRKLTMAIILSSSGLVLTMGTSMMAPALLEIGADLGLTSSSTQLVLSIYVLAQGIGPLIIAPCAEMYGRKPVWIMCSLWFILWNSLCPVNNSVGLMIAGRFMSGLGACVSTAVCLTSDLLLSRD